MDREAVNQPRKTKTMKVYLITFLWPSFLGGLGLATHYALKIIAWALNF